MVQRMLEIDDQWDWMIEHHSENPCGCESAVVQRCLRGNVQAWICTRGSAWVFGCEHWCVDASGHRCRKVQVDRCGGKVMRRSARPLSVRMDALLESRVEVHRVGTPLSSDPPSN
jgi:hypothetical protein